jgi:hypothetical protein
MKKVSHSLGENICNISEKSFVILNFHLKYIKDSPNSIIRNQTTQCEMGKRLQTLPTRRHVVDNWAYESVVNIIVSHEENDFKAAVWYFCTPIRMSKNKKKLMHKWHRSQNSHTLLGWKQNGRTTLESSSAKRKPRSGPLSPGLSMPLLGMYPKDMKACVQT